MKTIIRLSLVLLCIYGFYKGYEMIRKKSDPVKKLEHKLTSIPIGEIIKEPGKFEGEIAVSGRVSQSINILGIRYYKLMDADNPENVLLIIPKKNFVPEEGAQIRIKGHVKQLLKVGGVELVVIVETN